MRLRVQRHAPVGQLPRNGLLLHLERLQNSNESKAAFCEHQTEHHTHISANTFSPQIGSAVDHQSNKKSTTIPVAENQDYKMTLVGLTTGLWPFHTATYTARGNYLALAVYRSTARLTPLETDS